MLEAVIPSRKEAGDAGFLRLWRKTRGNGNHHINGTPVRDIRSGAES